MLSTIIISYNTAALTKQTILAVIADAQKSHIDQEVIVVDNASSDHSLETIKKLRQGHQNIRLIENKKNIGFARANNQAINQAQGEFIFLLNSDTVVLPNSLHHLINDLKKDKKLGLVAAQLLNANRTVQYQGGDLPTLANIANQMFFLDDLPLIGSWFHSPQKKLIAQTSPTPVGWVGGTAVMIKRQLIEEIGLLDEAIFMYAEDIDYCFRAHRAGWRIAIEPKARVIHYGSASSSSESAIRGEFKGLIYLFKKHRPAWQLTWLKLILKIAAYLRFYLFSIVKKNASAPYKKILSDLN